MTELAHALQAAHLAQGSGENESMIAAALLHDYGHLIHGLSENIAEQGANANHETVAMHWKNGVLLARLRLLAGM